MYVGLDSLLNPKPDLLGHSGSRDIDSRTLTLFR